MLQNIALSGLSHGETGFLYTIELPEAQRERLNSLGFTTDAPICRRFTAPGGSPIAFTVKGAVLALRKRDCDRIVVRRDG